MSSSKAANDRKAIVGYGPAGKNRRIPAAWLVNLPFVTIMHQLPYLEIYRPSKPVRRRNTQ